MMGVERSYLLAYGAGNQLKEQHCTDSHISSEPPSPFYFDPPAEDFQELLQQLLWGSNCAGNAFGSSSSVSVSETEEATGKETRSGISPRMMSQTVRGEEGEEDRERAAKRRKKKVAYPFAVLKPAGLEEGDVTLADINERVLKKPARAVRHPVGQFKSLPFANLARGLSGKAVVGLTRIHTQGMGTLTIIRTRG